MELKKRNYSVDFMKLILSLMIVSFHCLPELNRPFLIAVYEEWICRICVPFFFLSTGFFLKNADWNRIKKYIGKIIVLYFISILLYLPFDFRVYTSESLFNTLVFKGPHYHLWFFPALIIGVMLNYCMKGVKRKYQFAVVLMLFSFGIFFNEYYRFFMDKLPALDVIHFYLAKIGGTKNGVFFGFPMIYFGSTINNKNHDDFKLLVISSFLSLCECVLVLKTLSYPFLDLSVFGWVPAYYLLRICLKNEIFKAKQYPVFISKLSTIIYIIHPAIISFIRVIFHFDNYILIAMCSVVMSYVVSYFVCHFYFNSFFKK